MGAEVGLGCATIASKEEFMARNISSGRWPSRSPGGLLKPPVVDRECWRLWAQLRLLLALAGTLFLLAWAAPPLLAQAGTADDVHVVPRVKSDASKAPASDPALDTHTPAFRARVDLVLVPVTITDPMNRLVTGLERNDFQVFENNQRQVIRHFSSEDAPISLGVIFDISGSMSNKIDRSKEAVIEFFKTANPQDEFFVVSFSDKPELLSDFTTSVEDIQSRLVTAAPKGRTALLDAIYLAISKMRNAKYDRRALLIISGGGDNHSRYTEGEISSLIKEADVQIYGIGLFDQVPRTEEERSGPSLLAEITDVTGGRTFSIDNPNELPDVATKIGIELRNQYVLGYRPTKPVHDGKWHKIKVKLNPPKGLPPLHVYAKTGYYAPSQ